MATLKLTVIKARPLKDGHYRIQVALCHRHATAYIPTRFTVPSPDRLKGGKVVRCAEAATLNAKLRKLLDDYQERLDAVRHPGRCTCVQLKAILKGEQAEAVSSAGGAFSAYIKELEEKGSRSYADMMTRSMRRFAEFTGGDLPLDALTPQLVRSYSDRLARSGLSRATCAIELRNLRTVVNRAVRGGFVSYARHPFSDCRISASPVRECALPLDALKRLLDARPDERRLAAARDLFALSFYLGGMNLADLMEADFRGATVRFVRRKVASRTEEGVYTELPVIPRAREILDRRMNPKTGRLDFGYSFASYKDFSRHIARSVKLLAERVGVGDAVFYSARKTFAQLASDVGVPDSVIDYSLGHSDRGRGVLRYYAKVRVRQAEIALARVADYVDNPEKYRDCIEMRADIMMMKG